MYVFNNPGITLVLNVCCYYCLLLFACLFVDVSGSSVCAVVDATPGHVVRSGEACHIHVLRVPGAVCG